MNIRIDFLAPTKSIVRTSNLNGEIEILSPAVSINRSFALTAEIKSATQAYCELVADAANSMPEVIAASKKIESLLITDTASDPIASFPDGADGMPLKSLVVDIDPVQDLHGYANPWPAGGGKNKFNTDITHLKTINTSGTWNDNAYTSNGVIYTVNSDGSIKINGTASGTSIFYIEDNIPATEYTDTSVALSTSNISSITGEMYFQATVVNNSDSSVASRLRVTPTTDTRVGTVSSSQHVKDLFIRLSTGASANNVTAKFQFEAGSSATSWTPYENICPISGWTGADVTAAGKNLFDYDNFYDGYWLNGSFNGTGGALDYDTEAAKTGASLWGFVKVRVNPGSKIYLSGFKGQGGTYSAFYGETPDDIISTFLNTAQSGEKTVPAGAKWMGLCIHVGNGDDPKTSHPSAMVEIGSSASSFESYSGTTKSISFPSTIYGGTVDVVSGVLTVTHKKITVNEDTITLDPLSYQRFYFTDPDFTAGSTSVAADFICSMLKVVSNSVLHTTDYAIASGDLNSHGIRFRLDSSIDTLAKCKTYLASHPFDLVIPIDTPQTYQLTPQQITTLLGQNNIWADTGNTEVKYVADPRLFIEKLIAAIS